MNWSMSRAMNKIYNIVLAIALCVAVGCVKDESVVDHSDVKPFVEGELLVKFSPDVAAIIEQQGLSTRGAVTRSGVHTVDEVLATVGVYGLERLFPVDPSVEERTRLSGLHQWYIVRFDAQHTPQSVAQSLSSLGEVQRVDLNRKIKRAYSGKAKPLTEQHIKYLAATRASSVVNDPLYGLQWYLNNDGTMFTSGEGVKSIAGADIRAEGAWERSTGEESVIVAVLDEGVFLEHPDLKNNIWVNEKEVYNSERDNDGNGYKGDYNGYNFAAKQGPITWNDVYDYGHGTHVAGTIAAQNNNGIGIASIAGGDGSRGGVKIMVCQLFAGAMSADAIAVARAIKYAADNGAVILQCSWGYISGAADEVEWGLGYDTEEEWLAGSPLEKESLDYFIHNAGSANGPVEGGIAVYAAGNEWAPKSSYPGAAEENIAVAATAADFTPAVYTNYGPGTNISAPGGDQDYYYEYYDKDHARGEMGCILSTLPYHISPSGYGYMEGTSMATPQVSGVLALAISYAAEQRRHFKATEIMELLEQTATPIDEYMKGTKLYHRYVVDMDLVRPMTMDLAAYKGNMGAGQVNAAALLAAIDGGGVDMHFPNIYVALQGEVVVAASQYFIQGESLTYTVSISDGAVASCLVEGTKVTFKGLKSGVTKATIKASNGEEQSFNITVRQGANGNGWM